MLPGGRAKYLRQALLWAVARLEIEEVELDNKCSNEKPRIAVLGLGHVGLPTALGFVEMGWEVIGAMTMLQR